MERNTTEQKPDNIIFGEIKGTLGHRDTLTNCCQILEMLEYLDLSEGITKDAEFGFFLILETLIQQLTSVSNELKAQSP